MDTFINDLRNIIGSPPPGLEILEYIVASLLLVILCMSAVSFIGSIFKWIGDQ